MGVAFMERFKNHDQMKAFMKKEADRLDLKLHNVYVTFIARSFLEKLARHDSDGIVLVKGSSAETAYLGKLVRAITDVDIASTHGIEDACGIFSDVLHDDRDINFEFNKKPKITPTGIYKLSFDARYDKLRQPLGVDFQENYNRLIERQTRVMPKIFEGDEEFEIAVPSFEEYLAEKLCIILESNKPDVLNTRVKDFYDIYQLHGGQYDSEKLTKYFKRMLELRGKIAFADTTTRYLNRDFIMNHEGIWK